MTINNKVETTNGYGLHQFVLPSDEVYMANSVAKLVILN